MDLYSLIAKMERENNALKERVAKLEAAVFQALNPEPEKTEDTETLLGGEEDQP